MNGGHEFGAIPVHPVQKNLSSSQLAEQTVPGRSAGAILTGAKFSRKLMMREELTTKGTKNTKTDDNFPVHFRVFRAFRG